MPPPFFSLPGASPLSLSLSLSSLETAPSDLHRHAHITVRLGLLGPASLSDAVAIPSLLRGCTAAFGACTAALHAQDQLGEVVFCDLPSEGASFKAKETICTLESVKAVGEVYAPTDCEVIEVNGALNDEPALVNTSPMEDGWIVKVKVTGEAADMMEAAYAKHVQEEGGGES